MRLIALLILRLKVLSQMFGIQTEAHWSDLDRRNLSTFLTSQSGMRFCHQLRNMAIHATLASAYSKGGADYARGYQDCFSRLLQLSAMDPQRLVQPGHTSLTDKPEDVSDPEQELTGDVYSGSTIGI